MSLFEYEQELKRVVDATVESLGGEKENRAVKSYAANGEITYRDGSTGRFNYYFLKENWARIDYNEGNDEYTFSMHGRKGWKSHRTDSTFEESEFKRRDLAYMEALHMYENNLFDYRYRGLEIYFEGEISSMHMEAYVLRLTGFDYGEEVYYISKDNFRPFMKQVYLLKKRRDEEKVIHYIIDNYVQVGQVWMPQKISIEGDTTLMVLDFKHFDLDAHPEKDIFEN